MSKSRQKALRRAKKVQPVRRPAIPQPGPNGRLGRLPETELLEQIKQVRIERDDAEADLAALIDSAVSQGIGWPQIATQLGVSRQAARQQYQRRHPGTSVTRPDS